MASQLLGLIKALTWNRTDFPRRAGTKPTSGHIEAAHVSAPWKMAPWHFDQVRGSNSIRLRDNLRFEVNLDPAKTWVWEWVFNESPTFQADLLHHEQGHYNISALITRDCYVDVYLLIRETFPSVDALRAKINQIKANTVERIQKVHDLYDQKVHPEQRRGDTRGPEQKKWDMFISDAFNVYSERDTSTPDGVPVKVRLIDRIEREYPIF